MSEKRDKKNSQESKKLRVEHGGTSKSYAMLYNTTWHLLDQAKREVRGSACQLQAAAVFCAFTFEAYLNHIGDAEINFWSEIDRISYKKKLNAIAKRLSTYVNGSTEP